jgi:hypothetical protein
VCIHERWLSFRFTVIYRHYLFSAAEEDNASRLMVDNFYFEIGVYSSEN